MTLVISSETTRIREDFEKFIADNPTGFARSGDVENAMRAFEYAERAHRNMKRHSGALYLEHPVEVAKIVSQKIGLGAKSVIASLLHDIPEKTEISIEDLSQAFHPKVIKIIEGLQQIKKSEFFDNNTQASTFRQILLSVSDDIRVILIKIADKLHNIRTLDFLPPAQQKKVVHDTINIYAPLAHRLGLYEIKSEMEDLCLRYSNPYIYKSIAEKLDATESSREAFIGRFLEPVQENLQKTGITYRIESRTKSIYSIWKKMQTKDIPFDEVYDIFAVRIIFEPQNDETEKYDSLGIATKISEIYPEKSDRTRNWLDVPKETGYRALHITVMSNEGKWVEVQIRSEKMHSVAEYGFASHTKYKGIEEQKTEFDSKVREVLSLLTEDQITAEDFLDNLKINLFTENIFVFDRSGHPVSIPKKSTALDFAFKIHTDLAMKSIAAKINGTASPLHTILKSGDRLEIISSDNALPKKEWLEFVITHKAQSALKRHFRDEIQAINNKGKETISQLIKAENIENCKKAEEIIVDKLKLGQRSDLFRLVGEGKISTEEITNILRYFCNQKRGKFWRIKSPFAKQAQDLSHSWQDKFRIADCCNPFPGDELKALKFPDDNKIEVHKADCRIVLSHLKFGHVPINVEWDSYTAISELTRFIISGKDSVGVLNTMTSLISRDLDVNIKSLTLETGRGRFRIETELLTKDEDHADEIQTRLSALKFVEEVEIRYI